MLKSFFISAWRNLLKNKLFALLHVSGLSLGIAVCFIIGIWLHGELSFDNFHPSADKIFRLSNTFQSESESFSQAPSGPAFGAQIPKHVPSVVSACRVFNGSYKLKYQDRQFIETDVLDVDSNFFRFFGFELKYCNPETVLRGADQIVMTEDLSRKYFGNENSIGKTILLDDRYPMTVSGIAKNPPANSQIHFDLLVPAAFLKKQNLELYQFDIDNAWLGGWPKTFVQLLDPVEYKEAETEINQVAARFSKKEWEENKMSYHYFLQPIRDIHLRSNLRYDADNNGSLANVRIFSAVGVIVLLLACINYINLTTAGAIRRAKETSVRKVAGASRKVLVGLFLAETLAICTVSTLVGAGIAKLILPVFSNWLGHPYTFPASGSIVFLLPAAILLLSFLSGIYPALTLSSFNPVTTLKGVLQHSTKGQLLRMGLIVFQFTITIALIVSIFVITRQMNFIKTKSLGFEGNAVLEIRFFGEQNVIQNYTALRNRLLSSPHIKNVCKHGQNVVGGMGNGWTTTEDLKGNEISTSLYRMAVDTSYFDTYGMKLSAGRFFSREIPTDSVKAVIVNEAAVKTFGWKSPQNALGKRFGKGDDTRYVVGVIRDFNFESLHKPVEALMIIQSLRGSRLSLKLDAKHVDQAISHLKKEWTMLFPETPLEYQFIDESLANQYGSEQRMQGVFFILTGLSLLIACLGLLGLSVFVIERKKKEISIRKVLGASISGIIGLFSKDFVRLVIIASLIAAPLSVYFMHQWLQDFAYRTSIPWWVLAAASAIALLITFTTICLQAFKAAVTAPIKSLRTE